MNENNTVPPHPYTDRLRRTGLILSVASLFLLIGTTACQAAGAQSTFEPATGRFAPCPDSPNCVSTQAPTDDSEHTIAPLAYTGTAAAARDQLLAVIEALPRTTLVTNEAVADGYYLHVEFRSFVFRFVDDVEFHIKEGDKTIEFRSASRVGRSDLGVNRRRMEEIRSKFH